MHLINQDSLNSSIQFPPIGADTRAEILKELWNIDASSLKSHDKGSDYDIYFTYYADQCSLALHDGGRHIWTRTHRDVIEIAGYIKSSMTRYEIRERLRSKLSVPITANADEILDGSMNLTARLLLMTEFGNIPYGFTGRRQLIWTENSLGDSVKEYFNSPPKLGQDSVKLERIFTAQNLGRIAGIEIEWTRNLADHLLLIDEEKKVAIFHHASFLESQRGRCYPSSLDSTSDC